jgi:hypothetical protein
MEEVEVPLEHLHEEVHHSAEHSGEKWISWVALSTAILAVLAAIAGLLSGKHAGWCFLMQSSRDGRITSAICPSVGDFDFLQIWQTHVSLMVIRREIKAHSPALSIFRR